jgi:hypothetical protein
MLAIKVLRLTLLPAMESSFETLVFGLQTLQMDPPTRSPSVNAFEATSTWEHYEITMLGLETFPMPPTFLRAKLWYQTLVTEVVLGSVVNLSTAPLQPIVLRMMLGSIAGDQASGQPILLHVACTPVELTLATATVQLRS